MKKGFINKELYKIRLALGFDLKQASKLLHITKLHLKLIERGYLQVSKKMQKRFIEIYNLRSNFFQYNSNYISVIDKPIELKENTAKLKRFVSKPALRWTSLGLVCANLGLLGYGIYSLAKSTVRPRACWSGNFTKFWTNMKKEGTQLPSILYPGDSKFVVTGENKIKFDDGECEEYISTYGKEENAVDTNLDSKYTISKDNILHPVVVKNSYFTFEVFVYNKKKVIFSSFANAPLFPTFYINNALGVIDEYNTLTFRPFSYVQDGIKHDAKIDSPIHDEFSRLFNLYVQKAFANINEIFKERNLVYKDAFDLISDLKVISRDMILHFRLGIWFTILGIVFGVGFGFILGLSFYFYYQFKKKGTFLTKEIKQLEPKLIKLPKSLEKRYMRDIKSPLVIPEFVLTIIGLMILALSQISIYLSITYWFSSTMTWNPERLKNFSSNLLIAGVTILFYVKLDNYTKKSVRQLLITICLFIFGGIAFYVVECTVYLAFSSGNNIFSIIFSFLHSLLPGNFIWPLALYAALFFFLFTTPESLKNNIKKINRFRACSIIPTFFLLFSLIWQFTLKPYLGSSVPYYVQFLFFSKGATLTIFVLAYVYTLFFYQRWCKYRLGVQLSKDVFFDSKRYYLYKNSLAGIILGVLLIVEICFMFFKSDNAYNMGNNWAIGLIIPFVIFYHPHLGKRNVKWDISSATLKGILTVIGYIAAIIETITYMNLGDFFFMLS